MKVFTIIGRISGEEWICAELRNCASSLEAISKFKLRLAEPWHNCPTDEVEVLAVFDGIQIPIGGKLAS